MNEVYEKLQKCAAAVRAKTDFRPEVALVLGSGLGEYARNMDVKAQIAYSEIEGFPVSTVAGHDGRFLFGYVRGVPVVLMKGRVHFYEGYDMTDVVMPVRIMGLLGADKLILTNAAGGVNQDFAPGDLMMITDHISTFIKSPLIGPNVEELGTRFPDMSHVYDPELCEKIRQAAGRTGIKIREGIYLQCTGPNYETPAEIRMIRTLGADAVGMSTVCEAIAARHMGMRVCGISCITNMAAGILDQPLNHREVQETADRVKDSFERLITEVIVSLAPQRKP
ncbi:MAG: purine-nucleoside phosphorylase [Blautia sp.]|nr:purine-nucleoside phosphorylase [Blautia sp.]MDY5031732.1 purine-nucleoside phosphorylase [Blautia sp.]